MTWVAQATHVHSQELTARPQMGTNHFGPFLLTDLLLPSILKAPQGRIVNVASSAHQFASSGLNFDNLQSDGWFGYGALGWSAYGASKLANVMFTYELHRRLRRKGITHVDVNAIHPGVVDTELPRNLGLPMWPLLRVMGGLLTAEQGAAGQVMLSSDPALSGTSGLYFAAGDVPGTHVRTKSNGASYDAEAAERLWRVSEQLTGASYSALGAA